MKKENIRKKQNKIEKWKGRQSENRRYTHYWFGKDCCRSVLLLIKPYSTSIDCLSLPPYTRPPICYITSINKVYIYIPIHRMCTQHHHPLPGRHDLASHSNRVHARAFATFQCAKFQFDEMIFFYSCILFFSFSDGLIPGSHILTNGRLCGRHGPLCESILTNDGRSFYITLCDALRA